MKEVTSSEFFKALNADKRDIMPTIVGNWDKEAGGYTSEWRSTYSRQLFGKSVGSPPRTRFWLVGAAS